MLLTDVVSMALMAVTKMACNLQGLCRGVLKKCKVADEESTELELDLGDIESSGVRSRRVRDQTSETADDHADSPTTSATSGTLTPRTSERPLENQGMAAVPGAPAQIGQEGRRRS